MGRIKKKILDTYSVLDWKLDDETYACHICEWRARITDFPCFALALKLIVLALLSRCSAERIFLHLKLIQDACDGVYMKIDWKCDCLCNIMGTYMKSSMILRKMVGRIS